MSTFLSNITTCKGGRRDAPSANNAPTSNWRSPSPPKKRTRKINSQLNLIHVRSVPPDCGDGRWGSSVIPARDQRIFPWQSIISITPSPSTWMGSNCSCRPPFHRWNNPHSRWKDQRLALHLITPSRRITRPHLDQRIFLSTQPLANSSLWLRQKLELPHRVPAS